MDSIGDRVSLRVLIRENPISSATAAYLAAERDYHRSEGEAGATERAELAATKLRALLLADVND
jgi:hypothetical protein